MKLRKSQPVSGHYVTDVVVDVHHGFPVGALIRRRRLHGEPPLDQVMAELGFPVLDPTVEIHHDYRVIRVGYGMGPYYRLEAVSEIAKMDLARSSNFRGFNDVMSWQFSEHCLDAERRYDLVPE